jgi:hypothetical protein
MSFGFGHGLGLLRPFRRASLEQQILASFYGDGAAGMWYDVSDLSTLFEDAAGTTPATVNGVVGLMLDKSGNGNHASQATTASKPTLRGTPKAASMNGSATGATFGGWSGSAAAGYTGNGASGRVQWTNPSGLLTTPIVAGHHYLIISSAISVTSGSYVPIITGDTNVSGTSHGAAGVYSDVIIAPANPIDFRLFGSAFNGSVAQPAIYDITAGEVVAPYYLTPAATGNGLETQALDLSGPYYEIAGAQFADYAAGWNLHNYHWTNSGSILTMSAALERIQAAVALGGVSIVASSAAALPLAVSQIAEGIYDGATIVAAANGVDGTPQAAAGRNTDAGFPLQICKASPSGSTAHRYYGGIRRQGTVTPAQRALAQQFIASRSGATL